MRIHVCHLVTSFDTGGLQNGIVNLLNHGDTKRFRHTVLSMQPKDGMKRRLKHGDVRCLDFDGGRQRLAYRAIAAELKELRPDLLHTRNWGTWPDGLLAAMSAGIKRRVHGYHGRDLSNAHGESKKRQLIGRFLSGRVDRVICLTESMRSEFRRDFGTSNAKIRVIPNGIDLGRFDHASPASDLGPGFLIGSVGRLDAVKDYPTLFRAFAAMANRQPADRLLIVGDGPERTALEALRKELGLSDEIRILGERNDVPSIMKALDLYAQTSIYEGMSNTIVEAMALGVPVLATEVGGNADVTGGARTSRLVTARDEKALQLELESLRDSESKRRELGAAGRKRVRERFGLDKMVAAYEEIYAELGN